MKLRGIGGSVPIAAKGTLRLRFLDDNEREQILLVKNAYYAPKLKLRLLSPQQWSKQGPRTPDGKFIRSEETNGNVTILKFRGGTKTIPHNANNNLPILHTLPGIAAYSTFKESILNKDLNFTEDEHTQFQLNDPETFNENLLLK